jgi:hypothetical protein
MAVFTKATVTPVFAREIVTYIFAKAIVTYIFAEAIVAAVFADAFVAAVVAEVAVKAIVVTKVAVRASVAEAALPAVGKGPRVEIHIPVISIPLSRRPNRWLSVSGGCKADFECKTLARAAESGFCHQVGCGGCFR